MGKAEILFNAEREGALIDRFTREEPGFDLKAAYAIQEKLLRLHEGEGAKRIGFKLGLTSEAKMKQMNVHSPIFGELLDEMQLSIGKSYSVAMGIQTKIEPEICFYISQDIERPLKIEEVPAYIRSVGIAFELIDSRYKNFDFQLPDVVADNCSAHRFILGQSFKDRSALDVSNLRFTIRVNGENGTTGNSSAILGNPLKTICLLSEHLCSSKRYIPAGSLILAGAATEAFKLEPGKSLELCAPGFQSLKINTTN